jgi:outer membrane lipoprotein SlyB
LWHGARNLKRDSFRSNGMASMAIKFRGAAVALAALGILGSALAQAKRDDLITFGPVASAAAPASAPVAAPAQPLQRVQAAAPVAAPTVAPTAAPLAVPASAVKVAAPLVLCATCGTVLEVRTEKRKGSGGALGLIGGAVAGGMLGNQVGGGDGKKVATVAGAAGGAILGNELQKRLNRKTFHITTVKMKDGVQHIYESEQAPAWAVGDVVRLDGQTFVKP